MQDEVNTCCETKSASDPVCRQRNGCIKGTGSQKQTVQSTDVSLDELLRTSDYSSIHAPLTEENYHMLGREAIAKMKPGAIVINTARGGLIDEAALIQAVDIGHLTGAGIDCIEHMPLTKDDPLLGRKKQ